MKKLSYSGLVLVAVGLSGSSCARTPTTVSIARPDAAPRKIYLRVDGMMKSAGGAT